MNNSGVVFLVSWLAVGGLAAATMTWTGAGEDALWSNGTNWGGTAPGAADTAVFDATSAKSCTVDVEQVLNLTITADYTGTLTLANAFTVLNKHEQTGGTFTCGDFAYTVGTSSSLGTQYVQDGIFKLTGGTFNAPSGDFTWLPHRQHDYGVVTIDGGAYNANGGTFVAALIANNPNSSQLRVYNTTFHNFKTTTSRQASAIKCWMTNVVVKGDFNFEGSYLANQLSPLTPGGDTNKWVRNMRLLGDLHVGHYAYGGTLTVVLDTDKDQSVIFEPDDASVQPHCCGLIVNKPGKTVRVSANDRFACFGYGEIRRTPFANYGSNCFSGLWVEHGTLDFSGVDTATVLCDTDTTLVCAAHDDAAIRWPRDMEFNYRLKQKFLANGMVFTNLTLWSSGNCFMFGDAVTNTVTGNLALNSAGVGYDGSVKGSNYEGAGLKVDGNVWLDNPNAWVDMGGQANIIFCGSGDQVITVTNHAAIGTTVVDKPTGKVTVESLDGSPLTLACAADTAYGGSLFLRKGEIVFPSEGVSFTNCHFNYISQYDGTFSYEPGCVMRFGHRYGNPYTMTLAVTQALPSVVQTKGCVLTSSTGYPLRFGGDLKVEANRLEGDSEFVGSADQRYETAVSDLMFYKSGSSVYGGLTIAKTGGKLVCASPIRARNLTVADGSTIAFSITNATAAVTDRGAAGWNEPVLNAVRTLTLPDGGTVGLVGLNELRRSSPRKWNIFGYGTLSHYDTTQFETAIPKGTYPKLHQETTEKLLYLSYRYFSGLMIDFL